MSLKTDNFKLFKYEDSDLADLRFLHGSMDIIDKGINPFYVATLDSANTYKVITGLNKTVLNDGYSIKMAIPSNSTGAVSIIVDNVTVPLKQVNGNNVTNLKANGVYGLTYYNSVFILASGGGTDTVNFTSDKLLTGYSANDSNGEKVNGTMKNNGAKTATLNCGGSYTIPEGYHNGSGKITANSLSSQTSANATAKDIIKGKTAWVNGSKITGTATIQSLGGKKYATVTVKSSSSQSQVSSSGHAYTLEATGLTFKPEFMILIPANKYEKMCIYANGVFTMFTGRSPSYYHVDISATYGLYINNTGFKVPVSPSNTDFTCYLFGN